MVGDGIQIAGEVERRRWLPASAPSAPNAQAVPFLDGIVNNQSGLAWHCCDLSAWDRSLSHSSDSTCPAL